jgi:hypothetical protein
MRPANSFGRQHQTFIRVIASDIGASLYVYTIGESVSTLKVARNILDGRGHKQFLRLSDQPYG